MLYYLLSSGGNRHIAIANSPFFSSLPIVREQKEEKKTYSAYIHSSLCMVEIICNQNQSALCRDIGIRALSLRINIRKEGTMKS